MDFLIDPFLVDKTPLGGPVLVTGAGGCIGSWTLAILSRSGIPCVAFDLSDDRRRPCLLMDPTSAAELTWEIGDIADGDALKVLVGGICGRGFSFSPFLKSCRFPVGDVNS